MGETAILCIRGVLDSEARAIQKLKAGYISGLKSLVEIYQQSAVRAAASITRDQQTAEDVVSKCFLVVYERIQQFDSSRPFRPWFLKIVIHAALKAVGANARLMSLDAITAREAAIAGLDCENPWDHSPAIAMEHEAKLEELREALSRLTPKQRAILVLRYDLGLSEKEISARLAIPQGTVKSRTAAAVKRIRRLMADWF